MSVTSELGISPVLLQAISHTLTSSDRHLDLSTCITSSCRSVTMETKPALTASKTTMSHILHNMNEPVAGLLPSASPIGGGSGTSPSVTFDTNPHNEKDIHDLLGNNPKMAASPVASSDEGKEGKDVGGFVGHQDMSMVNVLTALASQHLKTKVEPVDNKETLHQSAQEVSEDSSAQSSNHEQQQQHQTQQQQQIIIYYNNDTLGVPSPSNDVVVGDMDSNGDGSGGYRIVMQTDREGGASEASGQQQIVMETIHIPPGLPENNAIPELGQPCPICMDRISGYHYGIFTCESCKGFFKRTVQNKKSFICHRQGECDINIYNRKKCPACRFTKCVIAGMKIEAIRQDRTRGGRSSYDGCSPHGRPRTSPIPKKIRKYPAVPRSRVEDSAPYPISSGVQVEVSKSQLVAILNHSSTERMAGGSGIPELLTDIMNLEPLLSDEEIPLDMIPEGIEESEESLYTYLMQITELRLYKLVRWARNLPQFGAISTDDQILLLQNCWSDLLCLGVSWRSIHYPGAIALTGGKSLSLDRAKQLGFEDLAFKLISLSEHFRKLKVDKYEYVALKVLLLISPDVKGLKDPHKIMEHQEKLSEALLTYTTCHSSQQPLKYGEMLLRLPELARISFIGKELLLNRLPANMTSCGLLVELLKGENAAKDI